MSDSIKNVFVHGGQLFTRSKSGIYVTQYNGKEPSDWTVEHFAGALEGIQSFQAFFFCEVQDMVNSTFIFDQDRQDLTDAIMVMVLEGLLPAFDELRSIRLYKDKPLPILNRKKHFENFARYLWHGYKDLWPKVAGLLGYDIGFVFQGDKAFSEGLDKFIEQHQPHLLLDVRELVTRQRTEWQQDFKTFRNDYLEHRKKEVAATVDRFYDPNWAEMVFVAVWRTVAELLSMFLESRFPPNISVVRAEPSATQGLEQRIWQVFPCSPVHRPQFTKIIKG